MDKARRRELKHQLVENELTEFKNGLPIDESVFTELFAYLNIELGKKGCDHTAILTKTFFNKEGISNQTLIIEWLADHGVYCDCEILANVEDLFEYLTPRVKFPRENQMMKQKLKSLKTDFGVCIEKISPPWNLI